MLLFVFLGKITSMKTPFFLIALSLVILSCGSGKSPVKIESNSDTVRIANDSLEYEIIIIEPGFNSWLVTQPKESFYSQEYLESKNRSFVVEYNYRVQNPNRYPNSLYPERIDYNPNIDYGKEVNYLLYNYFIYFQEKYHQHFIGSRN